MNVLPTGGADRTSSRPSELAHGAATGALELHSWSIPVHVYDPGLQRVVQCHASTADREGMLHAEPMLFVPGERKPARWDWFSVIDGYGSLLAAAFQAGYDRGRKADR